MVLELRDSLLSLSRIKCVLMPVGCAPPSPADSGSDNSKDNSVVINSSDCKQGSHDPATSKLRYNREYRECVRKLRSYRHSCVRTSDITPPSEWRADKSAFPNFCWQDGHISFNFVDHTSESTKTGDWVALQAHHRVFAVIGVCHCPTTPDIVTAYHEFQARAAPIP